MKIVFLDAATIGAIPLDEIAALGEFTAYPNSTRQEALERVKDCNVLIINKIIVDEELLDHAKNLSLICISATGVNNIDIEACKARGIEFRNVVNYSTDSVAQLSFSMILSLLCNLSYYDKRVKSGQYSASELFTDNSLHFTELSGKNFGIIGMGNIGRKMASIASAFSAKVSYHSVSGNPYNKDYPHKSLEDILSESDILSIHCPLTEKSANLISYKELSLMKSSAILVNTARGSIVNEADLAKALDEGLISGAALDVFSREPLSADSPLLRVKNPDRLLLTPHVAWASKESLTRLVKVIAEHIRAFKF